MSGACSGRARGPIVELASRRVTKSERGTFRVVFVNSCTSPSLSRWRGVGVKWVLVWLALSPLVVAQEPRELAGHLGAVSAAQFTPVAGRA